MKSAWSLLCLLPALSLAAPETLLDDGPKSTGWLLGPELRIANEGLGLGVKGGALFLAGDHGLLVGGQVNSLQLNQTGTRQDVLHYGVLLGYRFMPYAIGHLDTELILGMANISQSSVSESLYAAELNTAWKINVHKNVQIGAGVGVLLSSRPESAALEPLQEISGRLIFEFGSF